MPSPKPALSALNAYRIAKSRIVYKATLGWINCYPESSRPRTAEFAFAGASHRALELGYHLEEFYASTKEQWRRLPRILKSRGIEGLLLPPPPKIRDMEGMQAFPWHDFHAVALAFLCSELEHPEISAIDQNERQIGVEGANQLVDLLRRNERGAPEFCMHHLVEGRWLEAASTPRKG